MMAVRWCLAGDVTTAQTPAHGIHFVSIMGAFGLDIVFMKTTRTILDPLACIGKSDLRVHPLAARARQRQDC